MGFMESLSISASGMTAERLRMDVIANNIANANTTRTPDGGPYRRQQVLYAAGGTSFAEQLANVLHPGDHSSDTHGVTVVGIVPDNSPFKKVYDPGHPDADAKGYVSMPNVDTVTEMVDMMSATRAYEADVAATQAIKSMAQQAISIAKS
jgi:flagellar basal-body rod protein FlgC